MTKAKMVLHCCIAVVLIALALTTPTVAQSGSFKTIKIWPDQLIPEEPNRDYYQTVTDARNNRFYALLDLPNKAEISGITYYHFGDSSPAVTSLTILRIKMGNFSEELGFGNAWSIGTIIPVKVVFTGDHVIREGYRYYIEVMSANPDSFFMGAQITYREP